MLKSGYCIVQIEHVEHCVVVCVVSLSCTRAVYVDFKKLNFTPRKSQVYVQQKNSDATFFPVTAYLPLFLTAFFQVKRH